MRFQEREEREGAVEVTEQEIEQAIDPRGNEATMTLSPSSLSFNLSHSRLVWAVCHPTNNTYLRGC